MNRNSKQQALVLSIRRIGEDNRLVKFLTLEKGIIDAILYGGPKSKLRAMVSPFHFGTLWLYTDETKHSNKVTDFEVTKFHSEIRENLYKTWCADFCIELLIKTEASGESKSVWTLVNAFLDGLCLSTEDECKIALLRYIWRYITVLGLQCDCQYCVRCSEQLNADSVYSPSENGFICKNCILIEENNTLFPINYEGITFLQAVTMLSPKEARNIPLHYNSSMQLKEILFYMINRITDFKLKTLQMGSIL